MCEVVMTMVGEILEKARNNDHILRITTPISMMVRSVVVMATKRERQMLPKEVVATYVVDRMSFQGA